MDVIVFLWIIVICLFILNLVYLGLFLRTRPRTTKGLLGLLSSCLITLAALVGLIYAQTHSIDTFKSGSYFLFLAALFLEQVIAQWTLNDQAHVSPVRVHAVHWIKVIFTCLVICYTLFALIRVVFQL